MLLWFACFIEEEVFEVFIARRGLSCGFVFALVLGGMRLNLVRLGIKSIVAIKVY